jgi:hypothetical protein
MATGMSDADRPAMMRPVSPRISSLLHREPSQQELDVARHLVEHSQSAHHAVYDPQLSVDTQPNASRTTDQNRLPAHTSDYNPNATPTQQPSPGPSNSGSVSSMRRSPTASAAPAGQMCRYVDPGSIQTSLRKGSSLAHVLAGGAVTALEGKKVAEAAQPTTTAFRRQPKSRYDKPTLRLPSPHHPNSTCRPSCRTTFRRLRQRQTWSSRARTAEPQ